MDKFSVNPELVKAICLRILYEKVEATPAKVIKKQKMEEIRKEIREIMKEINKEEE